MVVDFCCPLLVNNSYTATHPFQYALHHSRPRKWVRNPRSSTGKEMKNWWNDNFDRNGDIFWSKSEADFCRNQKKSLVILLSSAFVSRASCPTGQLGVGSNMLEHVGENPKIPWFITMFPQKNNVHLGNIPHVQPPKIILSWLYTVIYTP